ncbi:MAG: leucyl aminopeptidase, partial [Euryarchaeota archaeon CG01_land_8_20_14_3_00_38_12]
KVLGTVHVAFGDNSTFGGKVSCGIHLDGIIKNPTLKIDDRIILDKGKLVV